MTVPSLLSLSLALLLALATSLASAAPTGQQVCQKMIADGRSGGLNQSQCECTYRVADKILDDDIKALLFEAWYTGKNNMAEIQKLRRPNRVRRQLQTLAGSLEANCG